jgi:ribokinase
VTAGEPGRVVVVGSLNTDHVVRVDRLPAPGATIASSAYLTAAGGKGLNQAVTAARQGVPTVMIGAVGRDGPGWDLLRIVDVEGIDHRLVRAVPAVATGVALVTVAADGANVIVVAAGANATVSVSQVERFSWRAGDVALCQLEIPLPAVAAALAGARAAGARTVLNPAPAAGPLPPALLALVDLLVPNEGEAAILAGNGSGGGGGTGGGTGGGLGGELGGAGSGRPGPIEDDLAGPRALAASSGATVIVTLGAQGSVVVTPEGAVRPVAAHPVVAVDTTAAGDAYCGALAAALAGGSDLDAAVRRASAAGSLAATREGAVPSLPTGAEVDALLAPPA